MGCFKKLDGDFLGFEFPSPCGVWVVSNGDKISTALGWFPSPCGVWVVSRWISLGDSANAVSVPLRGVGCFENGQRYICAYDVSVPLRGVGCFKAITQLFRVTPSFRPLAGCGLFPGKNICLTGTLAVSVPLRGVGCFGKAAHSFWCNRKKNCQLCCFIVSYWQMVYQ